MVKSSDHAFGSLVGMFPLRRWGHSFSCRGDVDCREVEDLLAARARWRSPNVPSEDRSMCCSNMIFAVGTTVTLAWTLRIYTALGRDHHRHHQSGATPPRDTSE